MLAEDLEGCNSALAPPERGSIFVDADRAGETCMLRLPGPLLFLIGLSATLLSFGSADSLSGRITTFPLPTKGSSPSALAMDPQGRVWYTALTANAIGVFDPATGEFREYPIPTRNARPYGLVADEKGRIWFTQNGNGKIGRLDPKTGRFREYYAPSARDLHTPVFDQQGFLWITAQRSNKIVRLNPRNYNVGEFRVPTRNARPTDIAVTPGRIIWFCELEGNKLGRLDPAAGEITEFTIPTPDSGPRRLAVDDTFVWFTEYRAGKLGRYNYHTGDWKEWNSPSGPESHPFGIAMAADGSVWYNEAGANRMVRFDPATETFTTYPMPSPNSIVPQIARGPNGALWLAVSGPRGTGSNQIARID